MTKNYDPILVASRAAIELDLYLRKRESDLTPVRQLSEILEAKIDPGNYLDPTFPYHPLIAILKKHMGAKITTVADLKTEMRGLVAKLKEPEAQPRTGLEALRDMCCELTEALCSRELGTYRRAVA